MEKELTCEAARKYEYTNFFITYEELVEKLKNKKKE